MKVTKKQLQEMIEEQMAGFPKPGPGWGKRRYPNSSSTKPPVSPPPRAKGDDVTMNISFRVLTKAGEKLDKASLREFAQKIKEYIASGEWGFFYASSDHPTKGSYDTDIQPTNIKVTAKKTGQ